MSEELTPLQAEAYRLALRLIVTAEDAGRLEDLVRVAEAELFRLAIGDE